VSYDTEIVVLLKLNFHLPRSLVIRFTCTCGKQLQAQDEYAGRHTSCPDCGRDLLIPDAGEVQEATAAPISSVPRPADRRREEGSWHDDELREGAEEGGPRRTSGKAIASLVLGIASFLCTIFTGIPAIVLGILGLVEISRSRGRLGGQGLAIGGIVTGGLGMVVSGIIAPLLLGLLLPAVQKVREAANRTVCSNNLKQLALAMHNYQRVHGRLPPAASQSKDGKPLLSWRVLLLPYLEHESLYKQFKLDEPWDSPHNQRLLAQMPSVFNDPSAPTLEQSTTYYQVFVGKGTAFESPQGHRLQDFPDGTSNTLLIVEAATAVPWTKPVDLSYAPDQPLPKLGGQHLGGFNAALADGSVRLIPQQTKDQVLRALITRNGGEKLPPDF
jgi:hypothetical protein